MEVVRTDSACSGLNYLDNDDEEDSNSVDNLLDILEKINTVRGMLPLTHFHTYSQSKFHLDLISSPGRTYV